MGSIRVKDHGSMKTPLRFVLPRLLCCAVLLVWMVPVRGQQPAFVIITPEKATMLVGETREFRLVDQNGQMQRYVLWDVSDSSALELDKGDQAKIRAKRTGDFRIGARTADGSAEATVKVMPGTTLPIGTVRWTSGTVPGCKTTRMVPAVPSASGADIFEESQCEDGQYVAAYREDGIQIWRRKLGRAVTAAQLMKGEGRGEKLSVRAGSICDLAQLGAEQQKIRELLSQHNLSHSEGATGERVWRVGEANMECRLWFDEKLILVKKRKILVNE